VLKVGDEVRLKLGLSDKGGRRGVAKIELFYSDIDGGVRLDKMLGGFYSWNVKDLEAAQ
jgi:hypothetical protein